MAPAHQAPNRTSRQHTVVPSAHRSHGANQFAPGVAHWEQTRDANNLGRRTRNPPDDPPDGGAAQPPEGQLGAQTCTVSSTLTGAPSGRLATPMALRMCRPASPKISPNNSEAPLATAG